MQGTNLLGRYFFLVLFHYYLIFGFSSIIIAILAGLLNFGRLFYWSVFLYTFCANSFFLVSLFFSKFFNNL